MTAESAVATTQAFVISRTFNASRQRIWQAFTEADRLKQWWGPKGFTMHTAKLDLKVGGGFLYGMTSPDGHEMWGRWTFREIVAPEKLAFDISFSDPEGGITRHSMSPNWPAVMRSSMTLAEAEGKTTLTCRVVGWDVSDVERKIFEDGFDSMNQGFNGTWDQLEDYLANA
ncbi:MAG TPA: SRPBCC domain-containing protein [Alphaproteobacteria bacterium]|jgi:uncharacterized protein YndB with AHSA1/START domain